MITMVSYCNKMYKTKTIQNHIRKKLSEVKRLEVGEMKRGRS